MTSLSETARLSGRATTGLFDTVIGTVGLWMDRSVSRSKLARMDPRMAEDIGLTPGDVMREANKPFWRA
ncbi:MAG: DUF1127 domain-containing protein [Pseudomonadota bacterium]